MTIQGLINELQDLITKGKHSPDTDIIVKMKRRHIYHNDKAVYGQKSNMIAIDLNIYLSNHIRRSITKTTTTISEEGNQWLEP